MFAALMALAVSLAPAAAEPLPGARRVLLLGDSITAAGLYTAYLEGYFATRYPEREIEFINLGLPSETISGLSEPSHPWPRPDVHERLDRALARLKPDLVMACYGMNDGIYHPFSEARFAAFRAGVEGLIARCRRDSVPLYLITPPPFDPLPVREILKGADATDFGWKTPYARYQEDVLARYAAWEKTLGGKGVTVLDLQSDVIEYLQKERRVRKNPDRTVAPDGVHPDADGHWVIAESLLRRMQCPIGRDLIRIDAKSLRATRDDIHDIRGEAGGLRFAWTVALPVPEDPDWSEALRTSDRLGKQPLAIAGLPEGRYTIYEGNRPIGDFEVRGGSVQLDMRKYPELSSNRRSDEIGALIRKRERILSPAWRDWVGHKRPDTEKGLPLDEAKKQAEPLTAEIRRLSRPITLELSLRRN